MPDFRWPDMQIPSHWIQLLVRRFFEAATESRRGRRSLLLKRMIDRSQRSH